MKRVKATARLFGLAAGLSMVITGLIGTEAFAQAGPPGGPPPPVGPPVGPPLSLITIDNTLGTQFDGQTLIPLQGNGASIVTIDAGLHGRQDQGSPNAFFSFANFSLRQGELAIFTSDIAATRNFIARVTADPQTQVIPVSEIAGAIVIDPANDGAAFWLINPSGVVFGPGAGFITTGPVYVSGGDRVVFPDDPQGQPAFYSALDIQGSTLATADPRGFGFLGLDAFGDITFNGVALALTSEATFIGGDVTIGQDSATGLTSNFETNASLALVAAGDQTRALTPFDPDDFAERGGGPVWRGVLSMLGDSAISAALDAGGVYLRGGRVQISGSSISLFNEVQSAGLPAEISIRGQEVEIGSEPLGVTAGGFRRSAIVVDNVSSGVGPGIRIEASAIPGQATSGLLSLDGVLVESLNQADGVGGDIAIAGSDVRVTALTEAGVIRTTASGGTAGGKISITAGLGPNGVPGLITLDGAPGPGVTGVLGVLVGSFTTAAATAGTISINSNGTLAPGEAGIILRNGASVQTSSLDTGGPAGAIQLVANFGNIELDASSLRTEVKSSTSGPGPNGPPQPDVFVVAENLTLRNGAEMLTVAEGASGSALRIRAGSLTMTSAPSGPQSRIATQSLGGTGGALEVLIGPNVSYGTQITGAASLNNALIQTAAFGSRNPQGQSAGRGGAATLSASGAVSLANGAVIETTLDDLALSSGALDLQASSFSLGAFSQIRTSTGGDRTAGAVALNALTSITADGQGAGFVTGGGSVFDLAGSGGAIALNAPTVRFLNGGGVFAQATGRFGAGAVTVNAQTIELNLGRVLIQAQQGATQSVTLNATTRLTAIDSALGTSTGAAAGVAAGDIILRGGAIELTANTVVSSNTSGGAAGGDLLVCCAANFLVDDAVMRTDASGAGQAGRIVVKSDTVTLRNNGVLLARGAAANAADIVVKAQTLTLDNGAIATQLRGVAGQSAPPAPAPRAGQIAVLAGTARIVGGGSIGIETGQPGVTGRIILQTNDLAVSGATSGIRSTVTQNVQGASGPILINARAAAIDPGRVTSTSTLGPAGQINFYVNAAGFDPRPAAIETNGDGTTTQADNIGTFPFSAADLNDDLCGSVCANFNPFGQLGAPSPLASGNPVEPPQISLPVGSTLIGSAGPPPGGAGPPASGPIGGPGAPPPPGGVFREEEEQRGEQREREAGASGPGRLVGIDMTIATDFDVDHDAYCAAAAAGDANTIVSARDAPRLLDPSAPRPALHAEGAGAQCAVPGAVSAGGR